MLNKNREYSLIKATVKNLIVAFIYLACFYALIFILFHAKLQTLKSTLNLITIKTSPKILADVTLNLKTKNLTSYPEYGTNYAHLTIPTLDISLPVYFGDTLSILKNGVGHSSGSYFPGEGGSILYMGHNNKGLLHNLPNININDLITITTTYGTYNYQVFDFKVIDYRDLDSVPITKDEEILMLYTCYPANILGHTSKRFIVYAKATD